MEQDGESRTAHCFYKQHIYWPLVNISSYCLEGTSLKRNCTRGREMGLPPAWAWYRWLSSVPGMGLNAKWKGCSFTYLWSGVQMLLQNNLWWILWVSQAGKTHSVLLLRAWQKCSSITMATANTPASHKRPELLCGELWSKLGGSRSGVYGWGKGVSSARFFLFLEQECLYRILSLLCLQEFGQREIDGREAEESPRGLLFFLWLPINVFIRQAADECHPSKDACRYALMQNLMGLVHKQTCLTAL